MSENVTRDDSMDVKGAIQARMEQTSQEFKHGEYVPGEDGKPGGILIDTEEELKQIMDDSTVRAVKDKLHEMEQESVQEYNQSDSILNNPNLFSDMKEMDLRKIRSIENEFANYDMTEKGLVRKDAVSQPDLPNNPPGDKVNVPNTRQVSDGQVQGGSTDDVAMVEASSVEFTVDAEHTEQFISTLSKEDREKLHRTKTVVVNEVKTLTIPTATRVITSADEYKRVIPKKIHSEVIEVPLLNSGYAATFHGCGSLAMASIIPDNDPDVPDYQKRYQFAYDNLVSTSIGKLSFNDFCLNTSAADIDTILLAILRASDPDENEILVNCRNESCNEQFKVRYRLSQLIDLDSITPEMDAEIQKIMTSKDVYTNAIAVHEQSKIMQSKYIEIKIPADPEIGASEQIIVIEITNTNGILAIERYPLIKELAEKYSRYIVGFVLVIPRIFITCVLEGETEPNTYQIDDPATILEIISDLNNESIQAIGIAADPIMEFDKLRYSFKGPINCPKCGNLIKKVPCTIDTLIFHRVEEAIR